jgi:hypothetical protein
LLVLIWLLSSLFLGAQQKLAASWSSLGLLQLACNCTAFKPCHAVLHRPTRELVENVIRNTQAALHASGEAVTAAAVEMRVARALYVGALSELGLGINPHELTALKDLIFIERKVHLSIAAYLATR